MISGTEILICLIALLAGVIVGTAISVIYYPRWEVRRLIRKQRSLGYDFGSWNHFSRLVDHNFRAVVKPNCETLYSTVFIRREDGPYILEYPSFEDYYNFAFLDMNTDVVAYITNREKGTGDKNYRLISFNSEIPINCDMPVISLSSDKCWIIGRFEIKCPADLEKVSAGQQAVRLIKYDEFNRNRGKED